MTSDELRGAIKLIAEAPGDDDTAAVSGEKFQVALLVGYEIALQLAIMNERESAGKFRERNLGRTGSWKQCQHCQADIDVDYWGIHFGNGKPICPMCCHPNDNASPSSLRVQCLFCRQYSDRGEWTQLDGTTLHRCPKCKTVSGSVS